MKAKPNFNGNEPVDFAKAGKNLLMATHELTTALYEVRSLIHGRNYQTYQEDAQDHLDEDKCRFVDHMIAVEALRDYAYEVLAVPAINANEED
jgi:hypothetical protein